MAFLCTQFTDILIADLKLECLLNIFIVLILSYAMSKLNKKHKKIAVIFVLLLSTNTIYNLFIDICLYPTQKYYFETPEKNIVLLVEVDKNTMLCGKEVNVYKQYLGILKRPFLMHEILVFGYTNIDVKWVNDREIELLIFDEENECRCVKIAYL